MKAQVLRLARPALRTARILAFAILAGGTASADVGPYARRAPSADGIGKLYMGREIAQVMSYHGASWLERAERMAEERPDLLLRELDLRPGMQVADIGAGTGYHAWRMAQAVGATGIVHAVDVQPQMLALLERRMAARGAANVKPILGTPADPRLPEARLDLALMVDVYHELEFPQEMLAAVVRALKPGGRVVFVEFKGEDARVPIRALHKMTVEQVRREAAVHPLEWERTVSTLPWQHVIVFRKR